jgi:uncharacterized protein YceK
MKTKVNNLARLCICCVTLCLIVSGCGTVAVTGERFLDPKPVGLYPATRMDAALVHDSATGGTFIFREPFYLSTVLFTIDLPISVVTDTLLLPVDIIALHRDEESNAETERIMTDMKTAIDLHRTRTGRLPATLEVLGLSVRADPWGNDVTYTIRNEADCELRSAGPDRIKGTRDDIKLTCHQHQPRHVR